MADATKTKEAPDSSSSSPPQLIDRQIDSLASFNKHTLDKFEVAGLLFYKELDCLLDLAYSVSLDFFDRPHRYRGVSDSIAIRLAKLHARYGYDEEFLSQAQRHALLAGVFGQNDAGGVPQAASAGAIAAGDFAGLRDQLLAAAAAFSERVFDTGADMLRAAVRIMHVYLKDYLEDVSGASVHWSRTVGLPAIAEKLSYVILRDPRVASRFGIDPPPGREWPFRVDAQGATMVEEISGQLWGRERQISRGRFDDKQQLALRGAEALATVIDYDGNPDPKLIDVLIRKCYTLYAARGRVLHLPVSVPTPAVPAPALPAPAVPAPTTPALTPPALTSGVATINGNRMLYGTAASTLPGTIS